MQSNSTQTNLFDDVPAKTTESDHRVCRTCKADQPIAEFYTYNNGQGPRRRRRCKSCCAGRRHEIRENGGVPPDRPAVTEKACTDCKAIKPIEDFAWQTTGGNPTRYRGSVCRPCRAIRSRDWNKKHARTKALNRNLLKNFGITLEEYNAILERQGGVCAVCRQAPTNTSTRTWRLHVDHCHKTGKVRALLCLNCNNGLGCFHDDPELLKSALRYLETHAE